MYCLCVNVYCTTATRFQPKCSCHIISYHITIQKQVYFERQIRTLKSLWQLRLYQLLLSLKKKFPQPAPPKCYKSNSPSCLSLTLSINRFVLFQNVETFMQFSHTIFFSENKLRNTMTDLRFPPRIRWDLRLSGY